MTITALHAPANRSVAASGPLQVTDLARRARVTPATVRYYARIGLLKPGRDARNGYRRFSGDDLQRLRFIRKAQTLGLSIGDIRTVLDRVEAGGPVCEFVAAMLQARLVEVHRQIAELHRTESRIVGALARWERAPHPAASAATPCPLIDAVDAERDGAAAAEGFESARVSRP